MKQTWTKKSPGNYWRSLEKRLLPSYAWKSDPFIFWQERILLVICGITAVFGIIALIPSLWLSIKDGFIGIAVLDLFSYAAVVAVLIFRNLSLRLRCGVVVTVVYILGAGLLFVLGPVGAGYIWLLMAAILISIFYDIKAVYITLLLNFFIFMTITVCLYLNILKWPMVMDNYLEKWMVMTVNFLLVNAFVTITTGMMLRSLKSHFRNEHEMRIKLEESEARLHAVFDSVDSIPIQGCDKNQRVIYWNRASERVYGYSAEEVSGRPLADLIIPDDIRQQAIDSISQWLNKGVRIPPGEQILKDKHNNPVYVYSDYVLITNRTGEKEMFFIDLDLSDLKRLQREKEYIEEQYRQAQKMESVGRLAGGVAHDFNNKLSVIIGYTELCLDHLDPEHPVYKPLQEIQEAGLRSADLTRQLLGFARKQEVSPRILDLNEVISGTLKMLQRLMGENIDITWQPGTEIWQVKLDASQLDQVLANLCANARDAIADQGRVIIQTRNVTLDEIYCFRHPDTAAGDFVLLEFSDNGNGMSEETLQNIFEPFFTTKDLGKGTGLGLAMIYGVVKQNKGIIDVKSEPGQGTTFKIYLPRYTAETTLPEDPPAALDSFPRGSEKILLVEDDIALLKVAQKSLEKLGYTVKPVTTPAEVIQIVKDRSYEFDLLMTDVIMPEMNGRELTKEIAALLPIVRIVYMSGYSANVISHHGVLDEGIHFIQKPFSLQKLATTVRKALDDI